MTVPSLRPALRIVDLPKYSRESILAMMSDPLKNLLGTIEAILDEEEMTNLRTERALGEHLARVAVNPVMFGEDAIEKVAAVCGVDPTRLCRAAWFCLKFTNLQELETLLERRGNRDYRLRLGHIFQLLKCDGPIHRGHVLAKAFDKRLTARELAVEIDTIDDLSPQEQRHLRSSPRSLDNAYDFLNRTLTMVLERFEVLDAQIVQPLEQMPIELLTQPMLTKLTRLRMGYERLIESATRHTQALAELEVKVVRDIRPDPVTSPEIRPRVLRRRQRSGRQAAPPVPVPRPSERLPPEAGQIEPHTQ